ncbi:MAG: glycosyltransferase family 2 protein [Candidatus Omnitrophica bacterium]|nr:glycosyltransferase family 2 protein [Candidatus Omnitrophota bacterium]
MKICLLIPAYNEAQALGSLVKDVRSRGFDVLVVDDGSKDSSAEIAREAGAMVLVNASNHGKGYSLQRGFDYILGRDYEALITIDGDGQHATDDLQKFVALFERDRPDIICGNRMRNPKGMPGVRFVTNKIMSGLISLVCRQKIYDTQCGYRLIRTEVLRNIQVSSTAFEIESEVIIKASKKGYRIVSVPIQTIYSNERSKINPFFDTVRFFVYIIREMFVR